MGTNFRDVCSVLKPEQSLEDNKDIRVVQHAKWPAET